MLTCDSCHAFLARGFSEDVFWGDVGAPYRDFFGYVIKDTQTDEGLDGG